MHGGRVHHAIDEIRHPVFLVSVCLSEFRQVVCSGIPDDEVESADVTWHQSELTEDSKHLFEVGLVMLVLILHKMMMIS